MWTDFLPPYRDLRYMLLKSRKAFGLWLKGRLQTLGFELRTDGWKSPPHPSPLSQSKSNQPIKFYPGCTSGSFCLDPPRVPTFVLVLSSDITTTLMASPQTTNKDDLIQK